MLILSKTRKIQGQVLYKNSPNFRHPNSLIFIQKYSFCMARPLLLPLHPYAPEALDSNELETIRALHTLA